MSSTTVVVTRAVPGEIRVEGARTVVAGDRKPTREELHGSIRGATVVVTMFSDPVDEAFLRAAGPQLKGVCNYAVGYDNIDLKACAAAGVIVTNTPHAVSEGTANLAWALILACSRRLIAADRFARSAEYAARGPLGITEFLGRDITGRNLLIVGAGRIGYVTAIRSIGWAMRIGYVSRSRHVDYEIAPLAAQRFAIEDGLRWADVVSVHCPLTPETRHLINGPRIALMKPTAILVNTSRGPVIDEEALARALREGRLWGAGLDVFENEPKVHPDLIGLDNCVLAPHIGSAEDRSRRMMSEMVSENAAAIVAGREPPNRVR